MKRYLFKDIFSKKITYTLMFIAALFRIAKTWKQLNCLSVGEWIKMWRTCIHTHTHTHIRILFSIKYVEILPFAAT